MEKETNREKISLHIKLASLLTLVPIIIVLLYYIIPSEYKPYLQNLSGNWKIHEGNNEKWKDKDFNDSKWKDIKLPGRFIKQGYKKNSYFLRKKFSLKEMMRNEDLFLLFGKTRAGVGRVYINGKQVGEIGLRKIKKNTVSGIRGLNGFTVFNEYLQKGKNIIAIHLMWIETSSYNGINDQRFYIGVNRYLKKYFLQNVFIYKFFQYGLICFSIFVIGLMLILLVNEWKSGDRYKYISTSLFVLGSLLYNITSSGSFIELNISYFLLNKLHGIFIPFLCITIVEFMQYYLLNRITRFGKINRFIASLVIVVIIFTTNLYSIEKINSLFSNYFILVILYLILISLREVFTRKKRKYGIIVAFAMLFGGLSGLSDLLVNLNIIKAPFIYSITISSISIAATVIVIMEFIGISTTNKRLTVTLGKANEELKEMDKLKSDFLANTSHELRTPINGIMGLAEAIMDGADGPINPRIENHLNMINKSGNNLKKLVNDILDFSKIQSGKLEYKKQETTVYEIIEKVKPVVEGLVIDRDVKIEYIIENELDILYVDKEKIYQVFINLIGNAVKFIEKGKVTIKIGNFNKDENFLLASVQDTGIGIEKEDFDVIFEEFRQADGSATRNYEGTGLGLAITKKIINAHGCRIWVESEVGKGSIFYFTMPRNNLDQSYITAINEKMIEEKTNSKELKIQEETKYGELNKGNGEVILVIDDNKVNLEVVKTRLEMNNWKIEVANNGETGLKRYREIKPDLILLDIMMPGMDGYEVCRKIRTEFDMDMVPIIFLTAKQEKRDKIYGINVGGDDFITKPFDKDELVIRVSNYLKSREMLKELREKEIIDRDIVLAKDIQKMLIPKSFPHNDNLEIYGGSQAARGVGGDYFDVIEIGDGKFLSVIADVMGKGISASLVMVKIQTLLRGLCEGKNIDLKKVVTKINKKIFTDLNGGSFITMFFMIYDSINGEIQYINAGHDHVVLCFKGEEKLKEIANELLPLGIKETYKEMEIKKETLNKGDIIVMYTDGINEAMNKKRQQFGIDRVHKLIFKNQRMDAKSIYKTIINEVDDFTEDISQNDDITLLIEKIK